jgi:hypothetical protein
MKISFDVDADTVEEVRDSLSRYSNGPASDQLVKSFLVHEALAGISFTVQEHLDDSVDLFVRQR